RIQKELDKGNVVIVTGFQGVSVDNDITTLGRGGSDTTAVALAAKLKADICEVYSDVGGVYTADPNIVPGARKLKEISYEEMLEATASGSKVLQLRSVEYARRYNVKIHVRSSFSDKSGTLVKEGDESMEKAIISSIAHTSGEAKVTILGVPDKPGIAASVFGALADSNINVDMILQNVSEKGFTDISFTVNKDDLKAASLVMDEVASELKAKGHDVDTKIAKISLIGAGMKSHPGIAATMFKVLAKNDINIDMISTSSIKISCVIREKEVEKALKALHKAFKLNK
ncbi:MAG: aspartate kinase, partial [Actinobacteria bacterium]